MSEEKNGGRSSLIGLVRVTGVALQDCHGPSTTRPGAQKPCAGKSRAASVGMTGKKAGEKSRAQLPVKVVAPLLN
jgi:hypothetical protein